MLLRGLPIQRESNYLANRSDRVTNYDSLVIQFPRASKLLASVVAAAAGLCLVSPVAACYLCGSYIPQMDAVPAATADVVFGQFAGTTEKRSWVKGLYCAVSEQFTHFGTLQFECDEVSNPTGQYLDSSITQLVTGYTFNSWFALQMN